MTWIAKTFLTQDEQSMEISPEQQYILDAIEKGLTLQALVLVTNGHAGSTYAHSLIHEEEENTQEEMVDHFAVRSLYTRRFIGLNDRVMLLHTISSEHVCMETYRVIYHLMF